MHNHNFYWIVNRENDLKLESMFIVSIFFFSLVLKLTIEKEVRPKGPTARSWGIIHQQLDQLPDKVHSTLSLWEERR